MGAASEAGTHTAAQASLIYWQSQGKKAWRPGLTLLKEKGSTGPGDEEFKQGPRSAPPVRADPERKTRDRGPDGGDPDSSGAGLGRPRTTAPAPAVGGDAEGAAVDRPWC